jgi:hypothetical protein
MISIQEEQTGINREAIYQKVLTEFIESLTEELEVAQNSKDLESNNEFDDFLEGAIAYGRSIDLETLDSRDPSEYRNAWVLWVKVRLDRAESCLSDDSYMSEFKDYDDEELEQAVYEWAGDCIGDFFDWPETTYMILSCFE